MSFQAGSKIADKYRNKIIAERVGFV